MSNSCADIIKALDVFRAMVVSLENNLEGPYKLSHDEQVARCLLQTTLNGGVEGDWSSAEAEVIRSREWQELAHQAQIIAAKMAELKKVRK